MDLFPEAQRAGAAQALGTRELTFRGRSADPLAPPARVTVAEAFATFAGIDLMATLQGGAVDRQALAQLAERAAIRVAADDSWSDIFSKILVDRVEPHLGLGRATILCDYPRPEAGWARLSGTNPEVAERFELYACGVELANGFGELIDSGEQRRRFEEAMGERHRIYGESYPLDEALLLALDNMPPASGVAFGIDRLLMLLTGASRVSDVIWAPLE